ncbi:hypothetical protein [Streptomyces sporangiiformans]|uniref:Uncharacterized protein n=1 Tax=Streptomyces sporangiiformans TaxID=2315329 RepID=A0A505DI73_9ACTN|nr:hypothetical protein [Streptomyces sporangiiformans]TPQ17799.1 hypothetical protein FGD71_034625 [Streptomyces sporangiiformans]
MTGRRVTNGQPDGDEHQRFARYLQDLAAVAAEDEVELVAEVLRDPDATMAQSAVVRHVDRRAAQLLSDPQFASWERDLATVIGEREFLKRRLREWALLRSVTLGEPWTAEELTTASDWLQRKATDMVTASDALILLAREGRTRRVRAAATVRIRQGDQHAG